MILALIGRYIISPYFSAVFLEAYLSASFQKDITVEALKASKFIGKPERKQLVNYNIGSSENLSQMILVQASKPKYADVTGTNSWLADSMPAIILHVKVLDALRGWEKGSAIIRGDMLFFFKGAESDLPLLKYVIMLPTAQISIPLSSNVVSETAVLGIMNLQTMVWIDAIHAFDFEGNAARRTPLVLSASNHQDIEKLFACLKEAGKYSPSTAVREARQSEMLLRGLCKDDGKTDMRSQDSSGYRSAVKKLISKDVFEAFVAVLICVSVLSKALVCIYPSSAHRALIETLEYLFQYLFATEVILRATANFPRNHFSEIWFVFDWFLVVSFCADAILKSSGKPPPAGPNLITRVQRLIKVAKSVSILRVGRLESVAKMVDFLCAMASDALGSFMAFLFVLTFSFSVVGLALFGQMCTDGDQMVLIDENKFKSTRCLLVQSPLLQFESFSSVEIGILTLIKVFTGDDWIGIMNKCNLSVNSRAENAVGDAIILLKQWNSTQSLTLQSHIINLVRSKLPGCQTVQELETLRLARVMDCSYGSQKPFESPCISNCGSVASQVYFPVFFFLSNSIIWNFIMSTLIEGLKELRARSRRQANARAQNLRKPIIKILRVKKLNIIYEVWTTNANRKERFRKVKRTSAMYAVKRIRYHRAWTFLLSCYWIARRKKLALSAARRFGARFLTECIVSWKALIDRYCFDETDNIVPASAESSNICCGSGRTIDALEIEGNYLQNASLCSSSDVLPANLASVPDPMPVSAYRASPAPSESSLPGAFSISSRTVTPDYVLEASFSFDAPQRSNARVVNTVNASKPHSIQHQISGGPQPATKMQMYLFSGPEKYNPGNLDRLPESAAVTDSVLPADKWLRRTRLSSCPERGAKRTSKGMFAAVESVSANSPPSFSSDASGTLQKARKQKTQIGQGRRPGKERSKGVAAVVAESGLDPADKLHVMRRGLAMRPRNVPLLRHYGELLAAAGEAREAEAVFQRALEIDPRDAGTLQAYLALARAGGDGRAAEVLEDLLRQATSIAKMNVVERQPTSRAEAEAMLGVVSTSGTVPARVAAVRPGVGAASRPVFTQPAPQSARSCGETGRTGRPKLMHC